MSLRTLIVLVASTLAVANASAARSWDQPEFFDAPFAATKSSAQARAETVSFLAMGGKQSLHTETSPAVVCVTDRSRAEVVAELASIQMKRSHENAERSTF